MSNLKFTIAACLLVVFGILVASVAKAEELSYVDAPFGRVLVVVGAIELGTSSRIDAALTEDPTIENVGFHSGGGVAQEGFLIGNVLSKHGVTAIVPPGGVCLSACAIGFLGAKEYIVRGVLGFHNMYIPAEVTVNIEDLQLLIIGQSFGVQTTAFFLANGFDVSLPMIIANLTTPERFVIFTSTEDLMIFFARTEEDNVSGYLDGTEGVDNTWIETHLWGPEEFSAYFIATQANPSKPNRSTVK